jgi:hypothetical protein
MRWGRRQSHASFSSSRRADKLPLANLPCRNQRATPLLRQPKQERERIVQVQERPRIGHAIQNMRVIIGDGTTRIVNEAESHR